MKYYQVYVDYNSYNKEMKKTFWKEMFKISDSFSMRFLYPFGNMYSDPFQEFFESNPNLKSECEANIIDKFNSKKYYDFTDSVTGTVYVCKMFNSFMNYIFENIDIFEWKESECPQDLCLLSDKRLVMYSCFHEEELILYLREENTESFLNSHLITTDQLIRIDKSDIPKLNRKMR